MTISITVLVMEITGSLQVSSCCGARLGSGTTLVCHNVCVQVHDFASG